MLNEYPKLISVAGQRVRVENAEHERTLTSGGAWSPPRAPAAAPPVAVGAEYPKILTHPDSGERVTVLNRDEEFHLRRFAGEFQERSSAEAGVPIGAFVTEPTGNIEAAPDFVPAIEVRFEPAAPKPAPRKRVRPSRAKK